MKEKLFDMKELALLKKPDIFKCKKVLCVQPHYDDNDIAAGALICKLVKMGVEIIYVTVTEGCLGISGSDLSKEQKNELRKKEQSDSAKISGVKKHLHLEHRDNGTYSIDELEIELIRILREEKPDMIMGPDPYLPYEAHTDHIKTGSAVLRATLNSGLEGYPPEIKTFPPHFLKGVALYYTEKPNTYFDVSDTWETKKDMIRQFKSQFQEPYLSDVFEYLDFQVKEHGKKINAVYAEGLRLMPVTALHCVVYYD